MSEDPAAGSAEKKLTKKQRRQQAQRRQLLTFGAIVLLVVVVTVVVLGVQHYRSSRAEKAPQDLRVTAVTADGEQEIAPYSVCRFDDADCRGTESALLPIPADGEITLKIPSEVSDHDWKLVQIFDDPAANEESSFAANEATEITLKGSSEKEDDNGGHPRLAVAEIQSILVDSSGDEEEPVAAVWSIAPTGQSDTEK